MPVYPEPTSYGLAEEPGFDFDDSPLADRPVLPEEMAAVLVEHLSNNFNHKKYLINPQLGYLATDTEGTDISIVSAMQADRSETFPKITVTPIPYKPSGSLSSLTEAGINIKVGNSFRTDSYADLLQGGCTCFIQGEYREQVRSLGSEIFMILMRDKPIIQNELHVKSFTPVMGNEEESDSIGKSQVPGRDFTESVNISWTSLLTTQMWTERAF